MTRCPHCYGSIEPLAVYCSACGKPASLSRPSITRPQPRPVPDPPLKSTAGVTVQVAIIFAIIGAITGSVIAVRRGVPTALKRSARAVEAQPVNTAEGLRAQLLEYLSQQNHSGIGFEEQVLGRARLELHKAAEGEVWFSLPAGDNSLPKISDEIKRFIADPAQLEMAREENGMLQAGSLSLTRRPDRALLFRTSADNVRFDPAQLLTFSFQRATYTVTLKEAVDYLTNRNAQGGNLQVRTGRREGLREFVFYNHGAYVARQGEPSLTRFAAGLTRHIPASDPQAREKRIQRLLDFVTTEIIYDDDEAASQEEILKHPVETLISHHGDCSNKAILLASLLEQSGEEYLFLYLHDHITVAVKAGRFNNRSGLVYNWENETWALAETTVAGFEIGTTRLSFARRGELPLVWSNALTAEALNKNQQEWLRQSVEFIQRPAQKNVIINAQTGAPLKFL